MHLPPSSTVSLLCKYRKRVFELLIYNFNLIWQFNRSFNFFQTTLPFNKTLYLKVWYCTFLCVPYTLPTTFRFHPSFSFMTLPLKFRDIRGQGNRILVKASSGSMAYTFKRISLVQHITKEAKRIIRLFILHKVFNNF